MRAMVLYKARTPLVLENRPLPDFQDHELLIRVITCGVCRTDLHIVDGDLTHGVLPIIPGHQIVGVIEAAGSKTEIPVGTRVGVAWLAKTCGTCFYCKRGQENLCDQALFTGYTKNGGFAEYCVADGNFVYPIPEEYSAEEVAPLLCAGLIGFRALRMTEQAQRIGLYGFGSSAHLIAQVLKFQRREFIAFTRPEDTKKQAFARTLGASQAGPFTMLVSPPLDAAIVFAPDGALIPYALKAVRKGGIVVCAGIHMTDIPSFPYKILWEERVLRSVTNLTREDGFEFLSIARQAPIKSHIHVFPLEKASEALEALRKGTHAGSIVLSIE